MGVTPKSGIHKLVRWLRRSSSYGIPKKKEDPQPEKEKQKECVEKEDEREEDVWTKLDKQTKSQIDETIANFVSSYKPRPHSSPVEPKDPTNSG